MRNLAIAIAVMMLAALGPVEAHADDAETLAAINQAADALDKAFERQDAKAIDSLTTDDHLAVTPYYAAPQAIAEQIKSLPDLKYAQTNLDAPKVTLLGPDAALRTFSAELKGTFKGRPIPSPVFVTSIMVNEGGKWQERFYQVTRLAGARSGSFGPCRDLIGTYLTKNGGEGEETGSITSRSLISFDRSGQVLFNDSGEAGEASYAPFSGAQGAWRCISEGDAVKARATVLDFTFPKVGEASAQIGRLDFELNYSAKAKGIEGKATLYLMPLQSDPLKQDGLGDGRHFKIEGERVELP
jgi:ketosteroid isomerase-like protein